MGSIIVTSLLWQDILFRCLFSQVSNYLIINLSEINQVRTKLGTVVLAYFIFYALALTETLINEMKGYLYFN